MPCWRAIHIRSRLEPVANKSLNDGKIETFYPRRIVRTHRKIDPYAERPYFPCYLFADLEGHSIRNVIDCRGIVAIVAGIIPVSVITELRSRADENGIIPEPPKRNGSIYRVHRPGVLGQLLVRLERVDEKRRARVFMRFLGLDLPLVFALSDLGEETAPSAAAFPDQFLCA